MGLFFFSKGDSRMILSHLLASVSVVFLLLFFVFFCFLFCLVMFLFRITALILSNCITCAALFGLSFSKVTPKKGYLPCVYKVRLLFVTSRNRAIRNRIITNHAKTGDTTLLKGARGEMVTKMGRIKNCLFYCCKMLKDQQNPSLATCFSSLTKSVEF